MSFAKLFSSITESSLWSEPKEVRLLFVSMLARCDAAGFIEAAVPGLERLSNLTPEEVRTSLVALEGPDVHSKNQENEGRRILKVPGGWMILNYEDYRNRRGEDERREYMRDYMKEYRRKLSVNNGKQNVNSVSHSKPPLAQAEAEAEAEEEKKGSRRCNPPSLEEVKLAAAKIGLSEQEAIKFHCHYESVGWVVGKARSPMKKWLSALTGWKTRSGQYSQANGQTPPTTDFDKVKLEQW